MSHQLSRGGGQVGQLNRDTWFLCSKVRLNLAYHPQTNGQFKRTIQSLNDLLSAFVLEQSRS